MDVVSDDRIRYDRDSRFLLLVSLDDSLIVILVLSCIVFGYDPVTFLPFFQTL